jgi:hypothetical protein
MKQVLLSLTLVFASLNLSAQTLDLEKVNQALSTLGAELIEGDQVFTALSAQVNPLKTDLSAQKIAGEFSTTASKTAWSENSSQMVLSASFEKLGNSVSQDGSAQTKSSVAVQGQLNTAVVTLIQYGWMLTGCEAGELSEFPSWYEYIGLQVCPALNAAIPELSSDVELVSLVDGTVVLVKETFENYLNFLNQKINEATDEQKKAQYQSLLYYAQETGKWLDSLEVTNKQTSIALKFSDSEFNFLVDISGSSLTLGLDAVVDFSTSQVDQGFAMLQAVLSGLIEEDPDKRQEIKDTLNQYLDFVRSVIAG